MITDNPEAGRVDVTVDGKPFTSYIYPDNIMKPVLYPITTASGHFVTRGWPLDPRPGERVDHPHHVGMWFNYGDVNGLDFWNNSESIPEEKKDKYGTIRHRSVNRVESGDERAVLEVTMDWLKPDGKALLREDTRFVFSGTEDTRTIERIFQGQQGRCAWHSACASARAPVQQAGEVYGCEWKSHDGGGTE